MTEQQKHEEISMHAYVYATDYIRDFNKIPDELNRKYLSQGLGNYLQLKRLNVLVWPDEDLGNNNSTVTVLGTYTNCYDNVNGVSDSIIGVIKINLKAHKGDFERIKETIRHEIAHAISHQINGVKDNHHNEIWIGIAKEHKVNIDRYKIEL